MTHQTDPQGQNSEDPHRRDTAGQVEDLAGDMDAPAASGAPDDPSEDTSTPGDAAGSGNPDGMARGRA